MDRKEEIFSKLSTNELFDRLMHSTIELMGLIQKENTKEYKALKKEVKLLQKMIIAKTAWKKKT